MKLGVLMDSIDGINIKKDSTFAMLLEAQARNYEIHYMTQNDIFIEKHKPYANTKTINVTDATTIYYNVLSSQKIKLAELMSY